MNPDDINPPRRKRPRPPGEAGAPPQDAGNAVDDLSSDAQGDDDKVGYCRPPKEHRFKPGVSGNPRGPRKGTRSLITLIDRAMDVKLELTEQGKKRMLTKREITALQVANKASKGNDKTIEMLIRHERAGSPEALQAAAVVAAEAAAAAPLSEHESSILDHFKAAALEAARRELRGEDIP